jgi:hypothetical protein
MKPSRKKAPNKAVKDTKGVKAAPAKATRDLFEVLESVLTKNTGALLVFTISLATLFGVLLFDVKISEGNDDALYIEGGYNYATDFTNFFFTANAPMYPMFLGLLISVFGINLILFKVISLLFFIGHIYILFRAFNGKIPSLLLWTILLLVSVNSYFLYYASQTYTESMFVFLQALFIYQISRVMDIESGDSWKPERFRPFILLGLFAFMITWCKSVALAGVLALIFLFFIRGDWKKLVWFSGSFAMFKGGYEVLKTAVWGSMAQSGQSDTLFLKDPYNAAKGKEELSGFVTRFFSNMDLYVSKRMFQILGFKDPENIDTNTFVSWFVFGLMALALFFIIKHRKRLLEFTTYHTAAVCAITFVVLQTRWDQPRLIMIIVPFIVLISLYGLYTIFKRTGWVGQFSFLIFIVMIVASSLMVTTRKSASNFPVLKKNLAGDVFHGYTNDWQNYLKMSRWCSENLPEGSYVAARKAPMSFVYGNGMKFFPVYNVIAIDTTTNLANPDSVLATFQREGVTHVMIANLRRNPKQVTQFVINTMHRNMQPVASKYPGKLTLVKQIGDSEPAYLYKINY